MQPKSFILQSDRA